MAVDYLGPILHDYVEHAARVLSPTPGRIIHIAPGQEVAWDDCCDGQLWSRVIQVTPHVTTSTRTAAGPPCGVDYWIATVALGVIRCAYSLAEDGTAPTAEQIESDGQQMLDDMAELQQVVLCNPNTWEIQTWTPTGPLGGCHGGEWVYTVKFQTCSCIEATPVRIGTRD